MASRQRLPVPAQLPDGHLSGWVARSQPWRKATFRGIGEYRLELVPQDIDNADRVLRVRHNRPDRATEWTLEIDAVEVTMAGDIHAWIERGSLPPTEFVTHVSESMTLSGARVRVLDVTQLL